LFCGSVFRLFVGVSCVQLLRVRIPLYWCFPLAFLVVGLTWWFRTRDVDFVTPPSEEKIELVMREARHGLAMPDIREDAISVPKEKPGLVTPEPPPLDLGDFGSPPELDEYGDQAGRGAPHLIMLAEALEQQGQFQRALLAWERVMDVGKAEPEQIRRALEVVKRLRPTLPDWNTDEEKARRVVLHAGTGPLLADELLPVMEKIAGEMELVSAGLLKVEVKITKGRSISDGKLPVPVALWLAGVEKESPTTEVVSFTAKAGDDLRPRILPLVYQLVRNHLRSNTEFVPVGELEEGDDVSEALAFRFTRLCWDEFGASLQVPEVEDAGDQEAEEEAEEESGEE
jgi:hypothetical protein